MALLLLFVFALFASGYVLREGLRKKEKTTHELLLKCVIIITSVVPRQLPMQVLSTHCFLCVKRQNIDMYSMLLLVYYY